VDGALTKGHAVVNGVRVGLVDEVHEALDTLNVAKNLANGLLGGGRQELADSLHDSTAISDYNNHILKVKTNVAAALNTNVFEIEKQMIKRMC
jgi:hypothetical protein